MTELEKTQKLLAFYMSEGDELAHPVEQEYHRLLEINPKYRTKAQKEKLSRLAGAIGDAADAEAKAFKESLDRVKI